MALWHGVEFYEKEKVVGEEFYQQWPNVSTETYYDKSSQKYTILYTNFVNANFFHENTTEPN